MVVPTGRTSDSSVEGFKARPESEGSGDRRAWHFGPFSLRADGHELLRGSEPVQLTPKALETLRVLLEGRGELVTREDLLREVWPESFVEEAVLTQNVYTLRKALADGDVTYIETVPRVGYRFVGKLREEIASPVDTAQRPAEARPKPKRGWLAGAAIVVVALLVGLVMRSTEPAAQRPAPIDSIAVLPFLPLSSADETDAALGLGLADALIVRLTSLDGLVVRPTSSVRSFVAGDRNSSSIARTLGVDAVIDGTIQRVDQRLRVSLQLIASGEEKPIWAETIDRVTTDLFAVQDAVAQAVVGRLAPELGSGAALAEVNPVAVEAYEAYLRGRYLWNKRSGPALDRAILAFEEAIALEPDYARAHSGLADSFVLQPLYGNWPPSAAFPRAISASATALSLDPRLAEAHTTLAYSRFFYEWDWKRAEQGFRRAIELNPSYATAHHWFAYFLTSRGRHEEAVQEVRTALSLDPVSLIINADTGFVYYFSGQLAAAEEQFEHTLELDPDFAYGRFGMGLTLEAAGRADEALDELEAAVALSGRSSAMLGAYGRALAVAGRDLEAREVLAVLLARSEDEYVQAGHVAMVYMGLGEDATTIEWWQRAVSERSRFALFFEVWPVFDTLSDSPDFRALVDRVSGSVPQSM